MLEMESLRSFFRDQEEIIDGCMYHMDLHQRGLFIGFLRNGFLLLKNIIARCMTAAQLAVFERRSLYGLDPVEKGSGERWRHHFSRSLIVVDDDSAMGTTDKTDLLARFLLTMISVFGMGGVGKTTPDAGACKAGASNLMLNNNEQISFSWYLRTEGLILSMICESGESKK